MQNLTREPWDQKLAFQIGFWNFDSPDFFAYLIARTFVWWKLATLDLYHGDGKSHRHKVSFCHRGIFASMIANWVSFFHFFVVFLERELRVVKQTDFEEEAQLHLEPFLVLSFRALSDDWSRAEKKSLQPVPKTRKTTRRPPLQSANDEFLSTATTPLVEL